MYSNHRIREFALMLTCVLGATANAYNPPPVVVFLQSPICWPLAAFNANYYASNCAGNSYDPDNGTPYCCDRGIAQHAWTLSYSCGSASIVGWAGSLNHSCAEFLFTCIGHHYIGHKVTDDDYPAANSGWVWCDMWVFSVDLDMPSNPSHCLGIGNTTDLSLAYAPSNLYAGYKKLSVNAGGLIDVLDGNNVVISGTTTEKKWKLRSGDPSSVTVRGASPGQVTLLLQYSPYGSTIPCPSCNGKSVNVTVVGVYHVEIYPNSTYGWVDISGSTITVLRGTKYSFRATPNPVGAQWPSQRPVWTLNGNSIGSLGDTSVQVAFDSEGTQTLVAKCGATDTGKTVTINVIAPQPDQISFVDNNEGEEHDIYGVSDPVWKRVDNPNNPASYTKNQKMTVNAKFWASASLTYPTQVRVDGSGFSEDSTVTFQSWPSETTVHIADNNLGDTIGLTTFYIDWSYRVASETNWISMTPHTGEHAVFRVFGPPTGLVPSNYTADNVANAVDKGGDASTEASIASKANDEVYDTVDEGCICNSAFQVNFDAAMGSPPTTGDKGMCCCRAEGLKCVLQVLGIGPYTHDYVNETNEPNPTRYNDERRCDLCGEDCERRYWAGAAMRWQGVIKAGGNGSTCYSPNEVGGRDEGTYAEFQATIEANYDYGWYYFPYDADCLCPHNLGEPNQPS